ncbi:MAG: hypothetical protein KGY66_03470 [Candidatus Thermoplasmatota archaeon]|nr:hypothetical protein [Candidatus Thermoplasmatota archaeon]MBS3789955.1 hypothetical protein [Candidatus Thermoplasmatota archaeon]
MSLFSPATVYRSFPLIFGLVSVIGYILKKLFVFDTGIFFTIISYLFANSGISPSVYNLLVIMMFFFLLIGIWFYARSTLFISGIEGISSDEYDIGLSMFRRSSLNEILTTILMGVLLSILASFIVLYSSLGITMSSLTETLLMIVLSVSVFFITFLVIKLFSLEKIKTGRDS